MAARAVLPFRRPKFHLLEQPAELDRSRIRSLPHLLKFNATYNPDHIFCIQNRGSGSDFRCFSTSISFIELEEAVERCCRWIRATLPNIIPPFLTQAGKVHRAPPVALFLESDVGLFVHLLALLSLEIPCVLLSIRLNTAGVLHLLQETSATFILVSTRTQNIALEALSSLGKQHGGAGVPPTAHIVATYEQIVASQYLSDSTRDGTSENEEHIHWAGNHGNNIKQENKFVQENDRKVLILHSSGTTGLPKPIYHTHRYLLGYAACHTFPADEMFRGPNISTLPLYHGFGLLAPCLALSVGLTVGFPSSSSIPTGRATLALIRQLRASSLMTVPSILEDIANNIDASGTGSGNDSNVDASALDVLTSLDFVAVGGGALKQAVGEKLSRSGVPILNHYGTTELGPLAPIHKPDAQYDWRYLRLRTDIGLKLIHISADASEPSEPSDPPSPEEQSSNQYHGCKSTVCRCKIIGYPFGWDSAFELQDDLECNPLHPDSEVRILGRRDDLIVLATGEKVLPLALEESISQCPLVKIVLAFGDGRFELGIMIEPSAAGRALDGSEIIDAVWPLILTANESADSFARVSSKTAIIITSANKVIPVSDKGSPMRKEAYHVFASEIEAVYKKLDDGSVSETSMEIELPSLEKNLQEMAQYCFQRKVAPGTWNINDDLFELGMDSLQATRLLRILVASIGNQKGLERISADYSRDFVYCHPSISKMAAVLRGSSHAQRRGTSDRATLMEKLLHQYEAKAKLLPVPTKPDMKIAVLLTGSTGSLGAHVLERMSKDPKVHQVICLIRRPVGVGSRGVSHSSIIQDPTLRAAQELANKSRRIFLPDEAWEKIEFLNWEAGAEHLGLKSEQYSRLSLLVTHIFHCAWPMDFKRELPSFERQIHAVKCLIDLAAAIHDARPHLTPRIVFASSIAVTGQYPLITKSHLVPEIAMDNPSVTLPIGYAEAKWICEKLMERATHVHQHKIQPVVVRIGQLSGSERTGHWNSSEHIPALIKASQDIGCFPDLHGNFSWLPVDRAAAIIADITLHSALPSLFVHLENPVRQPWHDACVVITRKLGLFNKALIPFDEWLKLVEDNEKSIASLVGFFKDHFERLSTGELVLDTQQARKLSPILRSTGAVNIKYLEACIDAWRDSGFLN